MTKRDELARGLTEDLAQQDKLRADTLNELRRALEAFGGSASGLAKAAGVSPSTITRPLKDPRGASLPKYATLARILKAAGLQPAGYVGPTKHATNFHLIEVVGEMRPGVWFESAEDRDYAPSVLISMASKHRLGALSAYLVGPEGIPYPPGTRVIVDSDLSPQIGDTAVLRREKGDLLETFAAVLDSDKDEAVYIRTLLDGRTQVMSADTEDTDGLAIMGTVVATVWFRP